VYLEKLQGHEDNERVIEQAPDYLLKWSPGGRTHLLVRSRTYIQRIMHLSRRCRFAIFETDALLFRTVNSFIASCSKLLLFEGSSAMLI